MKLTTVPIWLLLLLPALVAGGFWGVSIGAGAASAQTGAPAAPNELISLTVTADGEPHPLTPTFASSGRNLNIRQQRAPRLAFDPPQYLLMNEGETATYTVDLDTRWLGAEVTIAISSDNPDVTVSPESVSMSPTDWSARTITVTAADDADGEDDYATIRHIANGGHYNNVGGRLRVEVTDDGISAGAAQTGAPAPPNELISLTVTASGATRPLTPAFASGVISYDTYVGAYTGRAQIVMTPANPAAAISFDGDAPAAIGPRTETVSLAEGHNRFTITVTSPDLEPVTYHLNIRRQRAPRLAFDPQRVLMNEGESATYEVDLDTRWLGAEVVINISSDNPDITVSPEQVSISQYDWSARTITVTAAADADGEDDFATIRHIANGGHYNNVGGRLWVEVEDDDIAPASAPTGALAQVAALAATPGNQPGTVVLAWTPAAGATRYWVAGIKQTDWDAGDFSNVIWEAATGASTHTATGLDQGSLYAFTVAGGNDAGQWSPWSPLARVTAPPTEYPEPPAW